MTKQHVYLSDYLHFFQAVRAFFTQEKMLEVPVPPIVENPGIETHIHPFQMYSAHRQKLLPKYLHTSPEFFLKRILASGVEKIFSLQHSFRDEPNSLTHRPQFLMLEWYRTGVAYEAIMDDVENLFYFLINHSLSRGMVAEKWQSPHSFKWKRQTVRDLILECNNFDIDYYHDRQNFFSFLKDKFPTLGLQQSTVEQWEWEDLFFLYFLNFVEPKLQDIPLLILYEFPSPLAALSKIHPDKPQSALRFEVYIEGLEIANCFEELVNKKEFLLRWEKNKLSKQRLYHYQLPEPTSFSETMDKYPESSGIALGVERLYQKITNRPGVFYPGVFADDLSDPEA